MANTKQAITQLAGPTTDHGEVVLHLHLISDGSQETNLVFYDNSALINNVAVGTLMEVYISGKVSGVVRLNWDQTTPFKACSLGTGAEDKFSWRPFGGIKNPAGSGATGDLTMTTIGLASGDEFDIIIVVKQ